MSAGMLVLVVVVATIHLLLAGLAMVRWARSSRDTDLFDRADQDAGSDLET